MPPTALHEPTFLILTALAGERMHGYAIIRAARVLSDDRVVLKVGTLYAALDRLAGSGLVAEAGDEVVDGRLRRYYTLTDAGADALESETDRLEANARRARERLRQRAAARVPSAVAPACISGATA